MAATERAASALRSMVIGLALGGLGCDQDGGADASADPTGAGSSDEGTGETPVEPEPLDSATAQAWQLEAFEAEVLPMLSARCSTCHGPVAAQLGLVLGPAGEMSAAEVLEGLVDREAVAAPLPLVEPGRPEASWLRLKITGELDGVACNGGCGGPMPPAGEPVTDAELEALTRWIDAMEPTP